MTPQPQQPNPNELLLITRDELDRCCSQMSAAGYKVSANYVEASVLSRPATSPLAMENLTVGAVMAYEAGLKDGAAQARKEVLDALAQDWKGRYVEDAVAEIRRFPESLRTGGDE